MTASLNSITGRFIEWFFRAWVKLFGRRIKRSETAWLDGPLGAEDKIGANYYQKLLDNKALAVRINEPHAGLMGDFQKLKSAAFDPQKVNERVIDFYEHTTNYRLDVWSQWSPLFRPFAWLLVSTVSRRIQQLNLPISPLETSRGMSSDVIQLADEQTGEVFYTCWLRKVMATGDVVYAGFYSTCKPPNYEGECVKVSFPLPHGNTTVVLKPILHADGSLELKSSGWRFGDPGYYRIHQTGADDLKVRLIRALKESIHVYVDEGGTLRTDHIFRFWTLEMLRLHYKIIPAGD